ncbi:TetR/AcrR family transcriptional regulator [Phytoactinopolyspora mesophila]|uniref:TetR family transcriptional regulator n=1 Tax=Phytoactinopolyspora mesophila TaxID=2650750 RepID=A0A7K3M6M1_9ACTN|nr:TetR/AcrR family transcriptional regulator [Phytoactinopolyspora mesophila]NDL58961.1 TetR family transcriptional regulator [Phytoactinopolyspora mesophila]
MRTESSPRGRKRSSFIEQARRAQIIEAATETVAEVGYSRASLAEIAQRAGISKSVISYHFEGKDELLEQVAARLFEETWAYMEPRVYGETSAGAQIREWVRSQLSFFSSHRVSFLAMVEIVTHYQPKEGSSPFAQAIEEEAAELARILRKGQQDGEFRDFDPRAVAVIIGQAVEGALGQWIADDTIDLDTHALALVDFIDHAIRSERG